MNYVVALIGIFFLNGILYLENPSFFMIDDFEAQYLPAFVEIKRLVLHGLFPFTTRYNWFSGILLGEYQYALFNPLGWIGILAAATVAPAFGPNAAGLTYSTFMLSSIALSLVFLLQKLKAKSLIPALITIGFVYSGHLFYWGATTWIPTLLSFVPIPLIIYGLESQRLDDSFSRNKRKVVILMSVSFFMLFSSGWPFSILATFLLCTAYLIRHLLRKDYPSLFILISSSIAGLLLALMPIWAFAITTNFSMRSPTAHLVGNWIFSLPPLAFFNWLIPSFPTPFETWLQPADTSVGTTNNLNWVLSIPLFFFATLSTPLKSALTWRFFCLSVILYLCAMLPGILGFKCMFRLLPTTQLLLAISLIPFFNDLISKTLILEFSFKKLLIPMGVMFYLVIFVEYIPVIPFFDFLGIAFIISILIYFITNSVRTNIILSTLFLLALISALHGLKTNNHRNQIVPNLETDTTFFDNAMGLEKSRRYFSLFRSYDTHQLGSKWLLFGSLGLLQNDIEFVNGYSTLFPTYLNKNLNLYHNSASHLSHYREPFLNNNLMIKLNRFKIDGLIIAKKFFSEQLQLKGWEAAFENDISYVLHRKTPYSKIEKIISGPAILNARLISQNRRGEFKGEFLADISQMDSAVFFHTMRSPFHRLYINGKLTPLAAPNVFPIEVSLNEYALADQNRFVFENRLDKSKFPLFGLLAILGLILMFGSQHLFIFLSERQRTKS